MGQELVGGIDCVILDLMLFDHFARTNLQRGTKSIRTVHHYKSTKTYKVQSTLALRTPHYHRHPVTTDRC